MNRGRVARHIVKGDMKYMICIVHCSGSVYLERNIVFGEQPNDILVALFKE